ncbi:MAG: iron-containing alcohol dehydrogenase [Thermoplasmataceae archaeon]
MVNFTYCNPTRIEFGKGKEKDIGAYIASQKIKKILLCYGSERVKKDGLLSAITNSLSSYNIKFIEFSGIVSNPKLSKVYEGIETAKKEKIEGLLAVGGGSVLDSAKAIAAGFYYDGDVWDFFIKKAPVEKALPVFDVMTLAATGSEMNGYAVITNEKTKQKYSIASQAIYPRISVINPELMKTVSRQYLAYSAVDIIAHVIEGYFNATVQPHLQSRLVESIVQTVMETTEILLKEPNNYVSRAEFAWASTLALNGLTTAGTETFIYPNHLIEHSLSALFDIAHGAGLAIVIPAWMKWYYKRNESQFKRFSKTIFNLSDSLEGIYALEKWFKKIGAPTKLSDALIDASYIESIAENAQEMSKLNGLDKIYNKATIIEILKLAV